MAPRKSRNATPESQFPIVVKLGLELVSIEGDGNCLFRSLSHQMYGHQDKHAEIRAKVITFITANPDDYKTFLAANAGGGLRRNAKRSRAVFDDSMPSGADLDKAFATYLRDMSKLRTWGSELEINAFTKCYSMDVRVYKSTWTTFNTCGLPLQEGEQRQILHIAYHEFEHYSSLVNASGAHNQIPNVRPLDLEDLLIKQRVESPSVNPKATQPATRPIKTPTKKLAESPEAKTTILEANHGSKPTTEDEAPPAKKRQVSNTKKPIIKKATKPIKKESQPIKKESVKAKDNLMDFDYGSEPSTDDEAPPKPVTKEVKPVKQPTPEPTTPEQRAEAEKQAKIRADLCFSDDDDCISSRR